MEKINTNRGGYRPGSGRPSNVKGLSVALSVRITPEAAEHLNGVNNKSEYIDNLIKRDNGSDNRH